MFVVEDDKVSDKVIVGLGSRDFSWEEYKNIEISNILI